MEQPETPEEYQARIARIARMREAQEQAETRRKRDEANRRENQQRERERGQCLADAGYHHWLTVPQRGSRRRSDRKSRLPRSRHRQLRPKSRLRKRLVHGSSNFNAFVPRCLPLLAVETRRE